MPEMVSLRNNQDYRNTGTGTHRVKQPLLSTISSFLFAISLLFLSQQVFAVTVPAGDVAPHGNPDGVINVADVLILQRFVSGDLTPTAEEIVRGDVAPVGNANNILNAADISVLMQAILGSITLAPINLDPAVSLELTLVGADPLSVPIASTNDLVIRAVNSSGTTAKLFTGTVTLTTSDAQPPLHNQIVNFTATDFGEVTLVGQGLFTTLGAVTVTATSTPLTDGVLNVNVVLDEPTLYPVLASSTYLDGSLSISGFSYPGEQVDLFVDGQLLESTTAGAGGEFSFTVILDPGAHTVYVQATDPATSNVVISTMFGVAGPTAQDFPLLTSTAQEPVIDDDDADAAVTYPSNGSVVINSGEKRLDRTDLAIPGRGQINFNFYRRYRSQINYDGPLGFGWDFTYNERLAVSSNGDMVRANGMGHVDTWIRVGNSFTAPTGYFGTLTEEMDGTFILRETDGFKRTYSAAGLLLQYQDRSGNTMLFGYDPSDNLTLITDAFGRDYTLTYQNLAGRDRLTTLQDYSGRQVVYSYDSNGDLTSVRSPAVTGTSTGNDFPTGRTEAYSYESGNAQAVLNHNLLTITYPEEVAASGPAAITCTYGDTGIDLDRVLNMTIGGTNASGIAAGGTATYVYEAMNQAVPPGDADVLRLKVSVTERNGNGIAYFINEYEHLKTVWHLTQGLRPGEPSYYETSFYYDVDGQKTADIFPETNRIQYTYDSGGSRAAQKNLLEIRQLADFTRGGGADLVTTYTYEPVFNQLATKIDPRGNAVGFTPPIGSASAARYTTRYLYDYQENNDAIPDAVKYSIDLSGITRNLGDQNSDGLTNQIAGNRIRKEAPSVLLLAGSNEANRIGGTSQANLTEMQWNDRGQETAMIDPEGNLTQYAYYPENDPDGDGSTVPGQVSTAPKGYIESSTVDATPAPGRRTATVPPAVLETVFSYDAVGNVTSRRDPRGVETAYEVNQLNETIVETQGADISQAVASSQLITGETAFGYRTRSHYDFNGRVVLSETENVAAVSTTAGVGDWVARNYTYDILNNVVTSTIEVDASTTVVTQSRYDENELLTKIIKPEGNIVQTDYDERNLKFKVHNGFGAPEVAIMQYDYDLNGNLARVIDAEDNDGDTNPESTLYTYDGFDRNTVVTDALGNQTISTYDIASNIVRIQRMGHPANQPTFSNVLLSDVFYSHDELNRRYQIDKQLFLASGYEPLRPEDLRDENSDGFVTTRAEYDALSRLTFAVEDDNDVTQTVYDGASRAINAIDALGNQLLKTYDKNNNVIQEQSIEISPEGLVPNETFTSYYVYDQLDRQVRETDNAGRTSRYGYDSRDNPTTSSDGVGPMLGSDPLGLYPGAINGSGNTETQHYDGRDLMTQEITDLRAGGNGAGAIDTTNPLNADGLITVQYDYNNNSLLTGVTDDNGNTTGYSYDALDRMVVQTNADTTQHVFTYDRDNNVTLVVDPNGNIIADTFDVLNRIVSRNVTRGAGVTGTTVETYKYDGVSRLTFSSDNNGSLPTHTVEHFFDSLGRKIEEQEDAEPHSYVLSGDGYRLMLSYPTSRNIDMEYDANDRLKRIVDPFPAVTATASTAEGSVSAAAALAIADTSWMGPGSCCTCGCSSRPLLISMGNGTAMSYLDSGGTIDVGYNAVKEVVGLRHQLGASAFIDRTYTYNRAYMRTNEAFLDVVGSPVNTYTLDSAYRVASSLIGADSSPEGFSTQVDYQLDGVGNRRTVDYLQDFGGGATFGFADTYTINEMNEYADISTAVTGSIAAAAIGVRVHDNNGNLIDDEARLFAYDYKNRLVEVKRKSDNAPIARYEYDTENRRVRKTVYDLGNPGVVLEKRRYLYDDWNVIEEWLPEPDYSDNGPVVSYVYGTGLDNPVQMQTSVSSPSGAATFYYHLDARGNVVAMTDSAGVMVETTRYDDYGNFTQAIAIENPYLYQGRRYDPETGFFYFRNRYYDPQTGRFMQRDPVWDTNNSGNQYSFVGNNPITMTDPMGLKFVPPTKVQTVGTLDGNQTGITVAGFFLNAKCESCSPSACYKIVLDEFIISVGIKVASYLHDVKKGIHVTEGAKKFKRSKANMKKSRDHEVQHVRHIKSWHDNYVNIIASEFTTGCQFGTLGDCRAKLKLLLKKWNDKWNDFHVKEMAHQYGKWGAKSVEKPSKKGSVKKHKKKKKVKKRKKRKGGGITVSRGSKSKSGVSRSHSRRK